MHRARVAVSKLVAASYQSDVAINADGVVVKRHRLRDARTSGGLQHLRLALKHRRRVAVSQVGMVDLVESGYVLLDGRLRHRFQSGHYGLFVLRVVIGGGKSDRRQKYSTENRYE